MPSSLRIGERWIGEEHPPFIIAEVGINHEGSLGKALQCVEAAREAGADCVKFQCHITEAEMVPTDIKPGNSPDRLWDIIQRCELTEQEEQRVKAHCEHHGILYLCTPFSREAADRLQRMGVLAYKIGSGECNNLPLIDHIAQMRKPVILSTGMNDLASVRPSVEVLTRYQVPTALLHCTSMYPTPYEQVRLEAIRELQDAFGLPVGLSDHSVGIYTALGAVTLGACIIEKHFTVSRQWPGPDIPISIEPHELAELVKGTRAIHAARRGSKTILPQEQPVIDFAYASVVTIREVRAGEAFSRENLWVKRPGTGIRAAELDQVLGRRARRTLQANVVLSPEDIVE